MSGPAGERLKVAVGAAREAGDLLLDYRKRGVEIERKGRIDLVSDADRAAEKLIRQRLRAAFPDDLIVGEEGEQLTEDAVAARPRWYVDPLDGTTNYLHGSTHWAVSLGWCAPSGKLELGLVHAPAHNELFWATAGRGAWLVTPDEDGEPVRLQVTDVAALDEALVASGFPYDFDQGRTNLPEWAAVTPHARSVRCLGAAALELCEVARGHLDAFWEQRLERWDTAAGLVIAGEAGARITDLEGTPTSGPAVDIVVGGERLQPRLLEVLQSVE